MKEQIKFIDQAEAFMQGELSEMQQAEFMDYCRENPDKLAAFQAHEQLIKKLKAYQKRRLFMVQLAAHAERVDMPTMQKRIQGGGLRYFWKRNRQTMLVAASVALIAVFSTLWLSGFYSNVKETSFNYSALKRDMNSIRKNVNAQSVVLSNINSKQADKDAHASTFGATGFALTGNGFVATNYHVVQGADSVHVQNVHGTSFKARTIYIDPDYDLAILEIIDDRFEPTAQVPYTFRAQAADIGQDVFTIGFPREEAVYGQGYLSSETGYAGDTVAYQVSIPVNPGNSGGPLLDDQGNIIGIISGKQTGVDGASFAIKTNFLLESIQAIPADSLDKTLNIHTRNKMKGLSRTEQIKKMQDFIYMVKVY